MKVGVGTAVHYPYLVGQMPGVAAPTYDAPEMAKARRVLTVPCIPEMTDDEVAHVCASLARAAGLG